MPLIPSPRSHRTPRPARSPRLDATILGAASILALAMGSGAASGAADQVGSSAPPSVVADGTTAVDLAGEWLSADGAVRLELRADGEYERSITGRTKVARGTYRIEGLKIYLRDESGLRTTVAIYNGALEMAGHQLHRT